VIILCNQRGGDGVCADLAALGIAAAQVLD